jgi:hypothetical protein
MGGATSGIIGVFDRLHWPVSSVTAGAYAALWTNRVKNDTAAIAADQQEPSLFTAVGSAARSRRRTRPAARLSGNST